MYHHFDNWRNLFFTGSGALLEEAAAGADGVLGVFVVDGIELVQGRDVLHSLGGVPGEVRQVMASQTCLVSPVSSRPGLFEAWAADREKGTKQRWISVSYCCTR